MIVHLLYRLQSNFAHPEVYFSLRFLPYELLDRIPVMPGGFQGPDDIGRISVKIFAPMRKGYRHTLNRIR